MTGRDHNSVELRREASILTWIFALGVVLVAGLAACWAIRTAMNDFWITRAQQTSNEQVVLTDLARAAQWRPDLAPAWRLLADRTAAQNPELALTEARRAVALNPHDWQNWTSVALIQLQQNQIKAAEQSVQRIRSVSRAFGAYATAAGLDILLGRNDFYLRDLTHAFGQANPEQAISLLPAAIHALANTPDSFVEAASHVPPDTLPALIDALVNADHLDLAFRLAPDLKCAGSEATACRGTVLHLADQLSSDLYFRQSWASLEPNMIQLWNHAVTTQWLNQTPIAMGQVGDSQFQHSFQGPGYNWAVRNKDPEIRIQKAANSNAPLEIAFSGYESGNSVLLQQFVMVQPAAAYTIAVTARSQSLAEGLVVNIIDQGKIIGTLSPSLSSASITSKLSFRVPQTCSEVLLSIEYHRAYGKPLLEQTVTLQDLRLVREKVS